MQALPGWSIASCARSIGANSIDSDLLSLISTKSFLFMRKLRCTAEDTPSQHQEWPSQFPRSIIFLMSMGNKVGRSAYQFL